MPEIPDLNVFRKNLAARLIGKTLIRIDVLITRQLKLPVVAIQGALDGQVLTAIERSGKELHFTFDNGHVLRLHLMLPGTMFWYEGTNENRFTIAELMFSDGIGLAITDWQKTIILTLDPQPIGVPDAMDLPTDYLKYALTKITKPIKTALTEGKVVRGIGNAYVDENHTICNQ